ncbi:prohormone-3 [Homalodisca vitripennis]|nr:prohormone-3 [Homalodisca vitripennis]XP_046684061.1 prohormone-3 [Homalodisca vitripennis]
MLMLAALLLVAAQSLQPAQAWGGLFNRFSPEMLSNLGYGGHGSFRAQPFLQSPRETFQELQEIEKDQETDCYDLECVANDQCCPGQVCIILDSNIGHCVFVYGLRMGEFCQRDNECETGLVCMHTGDSRSCQPAISSRKQYSEDCMMSSECDIHKGLCCQFQRRHRQAPRKVCSYFKDPLVCIGPVASDQVKMVEMERTAGEKRLTAKSVANGYNHLKR